MRARDAIVVAAFAAACARNPVPAPAADIAPRVDAEINRIAALYASLMKSGLPKEVVGELERYGPLIDSARKAQTPAYRLYRLRTPFVGVETVAYVQKHPDAMKDLAALERLWISQRVRFAPRQPASKGRLLARALVDSGFNRGEKLYVASLTYGRITAPLFGLYYLGEAEGSVKFAEFVSSIEFGGSDEALPAASSLAATAERLQQEMLAGFEKDPNGRSMIAASSRMKEAREMLDGKKYAGATLALLETKLEISRQTGVASPAPNIANADSSSLGELWTAIHREHDDAKTRNIVAADVLPLLASFDKSAAPAPRARTASVTVTLVRWPYT